MHRVRKPKCQRDLAVLSGLEGTVSQGIQSLETELSTTSKKRGIALVQLCWGISLVVQWLGL